jgi:outer membrane cobalamin receptor
VSVATADDIDALGSTSLADVLRHVPGVNLDGTGREGGLTSLFSRGGESDYNLVLIDGVRVNLNGGAYDFSRIAASEIERVEVVRGAQSSLWGSDAIGSVVQIFTNRSRATDPARVSGSVEGGSFNTWRGDAQVSGGAAERVDYQAGVSRRQSDGAFADRLPEDDVFEQTAFNGGIGVVLGNRASVQTGVRYNDAEGRAVGALSYGVVNTGTAHDSKDLTWHATVAHTAGTRFAGTATVNYFRFDSTSENSIGDPSVGIFAILEGTHGALFPDGPRLVRLISQSEFNTLAGAGAMPAANQFLASATAFDFPGPPFETKFSRPGFRYQGDYTWATGQRLSAGYEWERETDRLVPLSLDNNAMFVQQQFSVSDRWFITAGVRFDRKESFDTFVSPKLSAGGFLLPYTRGAVSSVKVFGNVGKGIKSPSFAERLGASYADPNPDLKVERARTADIGVEATFADERLRGSATFFDNDYNDQIAFRFGSVGDGVPEFINIDGSQSRGWELELALQRPIAGFTAAGMYSFVDTEVVTNFSTSQQFQPGQPLLRRPKHSGTLRAAYTAGRATVNFNTRFVGHRHDNSFLFLRTVPNAAMPTAVTTDITVNPGYVVAGLGLDVRARDALTLFVRGDNIGDTEYESVLGYPALPRALVAGVRFNVVP